MTESGLSASDVAMLTNNNGFGGGNAWWLLILFLFAFSGWGNGYGRGGVQDSYTLSSDFATIQRQLSDGTNTIERKLDNQNAGICDLGYTQAQLINGVDKTVFQQTNALQSQLAQCCCDNKSAIADVKYTMAQNTNCITNAVNSGFCQTNFNNQNNTRDIIDAQNAGTRAILDAIQANKVEALNQRIAEQNQQINALNLAASQQAQNQYLISQLAPKLPVASYTVPNPFTGCCNTYCGCNS